ncbi:MAG: DUF1707 domain-containing protein [Marmoricola sp.]
MDDPQRPPEDRDRDAIAARINRVHSEGRITAADRDIRLRNAQSAQTMAELDLMSRDLDQLEQVLAPAGAAPAPVPQAEQPYGVFNPKSGGGLGGGGGSAQRVAIVIGVIVAIALVGGVAIAYVGNRIVDSTKGDSPAAPAAPEPGDPGDPAAPADADPEDPPAGPAYALTAQGIRSFLAAYRQKFGTSQVVDLTFYGDYVIVNVPVHGRARQEGWLYRQGKWQGFGGIRATFPGSAVIETNRLDIEKLMRNVTLARRTLNVEAPAQTYVILRFIPRIDEVPSVDIHVTNQYQESGYLATTLDGRVQRAYPYDR